MLWNSERNVVANTMSKWKKWLFWGKYKLQWRLSLHHSSTIWGQRLNRKRHVMIKSHDKENKHNHALAAHIRIGNFKWCKCGHCKNKAKEIDILFCREIDVMLIASAKIPEHEGSILPTSFYGQLPYQSHVLALST